MSTKNLLLKILLLAFLPSITYAQNDLTSRYLNRLQQSNDNDVTQFTPYKTAFSIPIIGSMNFYQYNSAFRFNDLITENNQIQPNLVIPKLRSENNNIVVGGQIDWFRMTKRIKDVQYSLTFSDVFSNRFDYSKDFIDLIWNGNAKFAGSYANLNNVRLNSTYYRSLTFGYTREINDKWTIGVRPKILFGLLNVTTKTAQASLYTDPNGFELSGNVKYDVYTSGYIEDTSDNSVLINGKDILNLKNFGLGLDAGVSYKVNDKLTLSANIKDLGYIRWKTKTANFHVDEYVKTNGIVINDSSSIVNADWEKLLDSLESKFNPKVDTKKYTTSLTTRISLSGNYQVNDWFNAYATINTFVYHKLFPSFTVGGTFTLNKYLQGTLNYSIMKNSYANLGLGLVLNLGPAQLFFVTDNIPAVFNPYNYKYTNISLGINITLKPIEK